MNPAHLEEIGLLATAAPHVRLAGLRLAALARELREVLATPAAGAPRALLDFADWAARAGPSAQAALRRLGAHLQQIGTRVLLHDRPSSVAEVDALVGALRDDSLVLVALREEAAAHDFDQSARAHAALAVERISARLRELARTCAVLSATILHPERMLADGLLEFDLSLDLDLAAELADLAAAARGQVALWRYC